MKQKNFFNKRTDTLLKQTAERSVPVVYKPWLKFKGLIQKHPKTALGCMLIILMINIGLLLKFDTFKINTISFSGLHTPFEDTAYHEDMGIPFNLENYRTMKNIQDTLSWLAGKQKRTAADTTTLLRLIEKIEKLDPLFFEKIKNATHGNDTLH